MDKPAGRTSHDVVALARRALRTRAVGHTGTLDPFATGLLVLLLGRATRLARFVESERKTYLATARLGFATATDDATGEPLAPEAPWPAEPAVVQAALADLVGPQTQRPPAYSAKHVAGERAYDRARRGEAVDLAPVPIEVHGIEFLGYAEGRLTFRATVSTGTYVRALARDLGARLGCGAHLTALRRERIGGLGVEQAVGLDGLGPAAVVPVLAVLQHLPRLTVSAAEARDLGFGRAIGGRTEAGLAGPVAAVGPEGTLVAIVQPTASGFQPEVVLEPAG